MEVELSQFQKDLLESVREMNVCRVVRASEVRALQMQEGVDTDVSSSARHYYNVSLKLKNSDT